MVEVSQIKYKNFIVKSNALIEARYRLNLQESQIILWLLTQIHHEDEDFKPHKLEVVEFVTLTGVKINNRYSELRRITKQLIQRVMEIYESETNETIQVSWLSSAHYKHKQGCVYLEFSPKLKPYLLQLKNHFTKIDIVDTLKLKSIYAVRVFELLLQYISIGKREISIANLRAYCGIEKQEYKLYADLKRKVIERAKSEITSKTEYEVDYIEIKESRKIAAIEWRIKKKNLEEERLKNQIKALDNELNYKFVLVTKLIEYGYSRSLADKLVKENGEIVIKNALLAVSTQLSKNQVKNLRAMLRTAIKEKWDPNLYKSKQEKEKIRKEIENESIRYTKDHDTHKVAAEHFKRLSDLIPKF